MKPVKTVMACMMTALLTIQIVSPPAYAGVEPRKGAADARIKTLTYRDNDVFEVKGHYGFTTLVELSPKESIETASIGDSEAWQIIRSTQRGNILFIKPLEPNAETNMTVLTNRHIYAFELSAAVASSFRSDDLAFRVRFIYPEDASDALQQAAMTAKKYDPLEGVDTSDWNFKYAYAGARRLKPETAFDDGTFTYFKFDTHDKTPAIFAVDGKGKESLVNFNIQGQYVVIERVGRQFTLRDGDDATCIFNEAYDAETGTQISKTAIKNTKKPQLPAMADAKNIPAITNEKQTSSVSNEVSPSLWASLGMRDANSSKAGFNQ